MQAVDRVDAWMINHISYIEDEDAHFGSGTYRYLGGRRWLLDTRDRWGEPTTMALREVLRDDWSITLTQDGSLNTLIDTFQRTVTNINRYGTRQKLGAMEEATIRTGGEYLTWIEVETPDGRLISFRNVLDGRWEATCDEGRTPVIVCDVEVERSSDRIEIRESTRGIRVIFDLDNASFTVVDGGSVLPATGTITAMGVPGPSSYEAGEPAVLTVTNPTHLELDVLWVDYLGHEIPRHRLAPGQEWVSPSFTGHLWMLRDVASRRRIHAGFLTESATVVASTADVRPVGGPPVQTTVKNLYIEPVNVLWVAPDASERPLGSLVPGAHLGVSGSAGDVLRVRSDGADLGDLLIGSDPIQYRPVVRGPLRAPDATLTFRNKSPLRVALGLRHDTGETRYHRMDPGEVLTQPTVAGETWIARDVDSHRVLLEVTAGAQDGEAIITSMAVRPPTPSLGDGSSTLSRRFRNTAADTGAALDGSELGAIVYRVDEDGHDTAGRLVPPGEEYVVDTVPGDVWRAREPITRREIGLWVIDRHGPSELPIAVRSTHSRVPVRLAIENRTMLTAEVLWLDGNGRAQPRGVLAPWSSLHVDTHATHMWLLRDRDSGLILDLHRVYLDEPTMLLDATDLLRLRGKDPLPVDIHNQAGFGFDVVDLANPTGSALATIEPDDEVQVQGHPGLALGMRDRSGGGVFATHVCVPGETGFSVRPQGVTSGVPTTVQLFNDSTLEVHVYCWRDGVESDIRWLNPRQSATLDTISGSVWLVREAVSGVVLTCALATGTPRRIRITGEHPQPPDAIEVDLDLINSSSVTVDIHAVAADGTQTQVGTMAPHGIASISSSFAATTRFLLHGTDLEIDRCITSEESPMVFEVANNLLADSVDPGGLRPGEVALYPEADFAGAPRVAHCSIASLRAAGIDSVGSLRVGPATGVVVARPGTHPAGSGQPDSQPTSDDVFTSDMPRLADTDVGTLMDSMEIFTVAESSRHSLDLSTSLTQTTRRASASATDTRPVTRLAHRSMIRFDSSVTAVQVWASSQMTAYVGDTAHTLSPTAPTTLRPTSGGTLSIAVDADTLGTPSLMLRTNVMPLRHRFFVYPDGAAMRSLRDQPDDLLSSHPADLGIDPTALGADAAARKTASTQVMTSLRQLASAAPGATVVDGTRHAPSPHRMDYDAWSLDRRGGTQFTPLAPSQLSAIGEGDNAEITHAEDLFAAFDRLVVQPVAASTQIAFTSLDRLGRDAVLTVEQAATAVQTTILEPVLRTIDDVIVQPTLAAAAQGLAALGQAIDGAGELLATMAAEAAQTLTTIADLVLAVTIQQGEQLSRVILDTAEKVGAVVTAVLEEIGAAIASVAQWLANLFDWDAIKATHALIVDDLTPQLMGKVDAWLGLLGGQVSTATTESSAAVRAALTGVGDLLDTIPPPPRSTKGADAPSGESTDSFLDRLFAEIDAGTVALGATTNAPDLSDLEPQVTALLEQLGAAVSGVLETIVAGVGAAASSPPEELGRRVLGLLIESMATITDAIFAIVDAVGQLAITLLGRVSGAIHEALTVPLDVPILSDLYRDNLGRPMTPLGLAALLVATPATAAGRGAMGEQWPPTDIALSMKPLTQLKLAIGGGTYLGGTVTSPIRLAVPDPPPLRGLLLAIDVTMTVIPFLAELPDPADPTPGSLDDKLGTFADMLAGAVVCLNLTSAWVTYTGLGRGVPITRRQRRADDSRALNTLSAWCGVVSGVLSVVSDFDLLVRHPTTGNQLTVIHGLLAQFIMLSTLLGTAGDTPASPWDPRLITEMVMSGAGNLGAGITMVLSLDA